ncbi:MAG TPA: DUF2497 domain-containing protein [Rhodospirillaceae bacterium]|nr:DUF2497 domain-containing protein [Rhodospirillaceae bacterium]
MEEILASIRKIISEDGEDEPPKKEKPAPEPQPEPEPEPEPMELEDEVEEEPLELEDEVEDELPDLELVDMDDDEEEYVPPPPPPAPPEPEPEEEEEEEYVPPPPPPRRPAPPMMSDDDRILSDDVEGYGISQFASLERKIRMGQAGETLEDVVKGLLKPMLRGWLDENLPGLVERLVQEEIQRMSHRARKRWDDDQT